MQVAVGGDMVISAADISVVIPAINEQDNIVGAVESALGAGAVEVWVADGGSTDNTIEYACQAGALVCCSDAGRAVQQNNGAQHATKTILCFLHADNRLDSAALHQAASYFSEDQTNSSRRTDYGAGPPDRGLLSTCQEPDLFIAS